MQGPLTTVPSRALDTTAHVTDLEIPNRQTLMVEVAKLMKRIGRLPILSDNAASGNAIMLMLDLAIMSKKFASPYVLVNMHGANAAAEIMPA